MPLPPSAARSRALAVVSRFNEGVTRKLLAGALQALAAGGYPASDVDVVWVPGAFELPLALRRGLATGRYGVAVALGAVIRGETPHFDVVVDNASRGIAEASLQADIPVGFGLLTCDSLAQALDRAGGARGNKGEEAAQAALDTRAALEAFDGGE